MGCSLVGGGFILGQEASWLMRFYGWLMTRWPRLGRWVRRPGPMFWDVVLAFALAVLSLVSIGWDRGADQQAPRSDVDIVLDPSPDGLAAGEPWDVEITVREADPSLWNVTPRLMITNTGTGVSMTFEARANRNAWCVSGASGVSCRGQLRL